jgi:hypothetical protein
MFFLNYRYQLVGSGETRVMVSHWNAGARFSLGPELFGRSRGDRRLQCWAKLYLAPRHSLQCHPETIFARSQSVVASSRTEWTSSLFLSPGIRWAYNFKDGLQIVPGVGVPLGVGPSAGERHTPLPELRAPVSQDTEKVRRPNSEAHKHRLRLQPNVPEFFHALLNMIFQSQDVCGGGRSVVHDG